MLEGGHHLSCHTHMESSWWYYRRLEFVIKVIVSWGPVSSMPGEEMALKFDSIVAHGR